MRIVHVISTLDPRAGGPPAALVGLASAQQQVGLSVCVVATYTRNADLRLAQTLRENGVDVQLVGPVRTPLGLHRDLAPTLRRVIGEADVVHMHGLWEEIQHRGAVLARRFDKPYVIRPCGMLDPWSLSQSRLKKRAYLVWRLRHNLKRASALHFTTERERELTAPLKLGAPTIVEPNGLDLSQFDPLPERHRFRERYSIADHVPVLIFLSRIHFKKGLDLLIPAFAKANISDALLVIAGTGEAKAIEPLKSMTEAHGIADRTRWIGMLHGSERIAALADADLFALPSRQENFGIAVVEALAAGTPVVVSDQVNIHREITNEKLGAVVPMDIDRLAEALGHWLSDRTAREDLGRKARSFVWSQYDWKQIANRWRGHYRELM